MTFTPPDLSGQTAFITGTTRGIGKQIALGLARQGCNIVSTGKTSESNEYGKRDDLEGTIEQTARECKQRGVETLSIELDVRDQDNVHRAVDQAVDHFGEINIVINNASAIQLAAVDEIPANRFDLLTEVNVRGTYLVSRAFIEHLSNTDSNAWILSNSPPLLVDRAPNKAAYAWSKLGMTFVTLSLADELADQDIGCNTFWPVTAIDTRATRYFGLGTEDDWRRPNIVSDTVLAILTRDPREFTGNAVYDEQMLNEVGVADFTRYNLTDGDPPPMSARMFDPEFQRS
ncbi:SDR family oxidoreductase [Salinarchaeum sp. IM2453]|uniref:SDR family oxidoreductase n=1 Tax=Salinarchaeum sp. IM2453 TaxID=2862870 RepID=UPI001C82CE94|nr:SDR family oxidoreductase [Salinarchaeum sp. IM2453]QZA88003.1 SDR family oxidoreductase [Salinarchaeum sp. IM2453]